ncbi:NAD(P)/FAD-dependent oxidoreductase [Alteribacillus bidgolensis]|uniref:3-phenylpropionate/trans-cinnamate dioxygenase ferredoxin reductase subunit n=1 Tax=Alteribacillus bidgolensis TaxID=930129 RepID=A0A1G8ECR4_9BACI|nr:FAD/NAD(P)-binding oxidoreductase [Alteribacillus bidgolensis]SDH67663.1 3-phenylpropionate/trans-cinnamate dioxygenase ferredoxin reductase subunit [Alteribacillus bidgolensis]
MLDYNSTLIIGGGIAGHHAAKSLRKEGFEGNITLVEGEAEVPYDRPPLSKEYLSGAQEEKDFTLFSKEEYTELSVNLLSGVKAKKIHAEECKVETDDGRFFPYSNLILATGSSLRKLSVDGDHLDGIHYLKSLSDARKLKNSLTKIKRIAIIGAGFIGLEVAAVCREKGIEVSVIEMGDLPMSHLFGKEAGQYFYDIHDRKDVTFLTNDSVSHFEGERKVEKIRTKKGKVVPCDAVVIGIGVMPNTSITHPDLQVNKGYITDEYGRTTLPHVYAAGDCAEWTYQNKSIVVAHWDHAMNQGKSIAKNIVHNHSEPYRAVPFFWSNQYDQQFQFVGLPLQDATIVFRGSPEDGEFSCFYADNNQVIHGALMVNQPKNVIPARKFIQKQQAMDLQQISDPTILLKKVQPLQKI